MASGGVRWWREWLSASPGGATTARAPGRAEALYRRIAALVSRHATAADTALAVAVALGTMPQLVHWARTETGQFAKIAIFSALLVVPLIWRRRYPLSVFAFIAVVALAEWIASVKGTADLALLIYLYTVASRYPARVGVLAGAVVEVGVAMAAGQWQLTRNWLESFLLLSGPVAASLLLGVTVRHWRSSLLALTERAEQLERERDQQTRIAAAAERTRIAREMHDVVAHSLSVMVTLAEGAALKQATEPERAVLAMRQVTDTGRQSLDEMRRLLGVLRTEDDPGSRQPQPGMAQLSELFSQVRATGLAAGLTVTGTPAAMPPGAELTVFRIVQEALTNTLKHAASPTRVDVAIAHRLGSVTVDIHDDGARPARPGAGGCGPGLAGQGLAGQGLAGQGLAGHGLAGMRERAAVYGGSVAAGPGPSGGWVIHAQLPLVASRPAAAGRTR